MSRPLRIQYPNAWYHVMKHIPIIIGDKDILLIIPSRKNMIKCTFINEWMVTSAILQFFYNPHQGLGIPHIAWKDNISQAGMAAFGS